MLEDLLPFLRGVEALGRLLEPDNPQTATFIMHADLSGRITYGDKTVCRFGTIRELYEHIEGNPSDVEFNDLQMEEDDVDPDDE